MSVASVSAEIEPLQLSRPRIRVVWAFGAVVVLLIAITLSILVGANALSAHLIIETLTGGGTNESRFVVWDQRVPRTAAGLAVGAALGVSGALIQGLTRNPLADPGILGVNAGAAFFVAVGITFLGITSPIGYVWLACAGALVLTVVVYVIGSGGSEAAGTIRLTVTGVAFGAVLSGLTTGVALTHPDSFDRLRGWSAGSLLERGFDVVLPVLPLVIVGLLIAFAVAPGLNSVALGTEIAQAQGVNVRRMQVLVLVAVTVLAGSGTAIAGPIAFVGLVVPHVVRWTIGTDQRRIILGSLMLGPSLILLSDVLGRILVLPSEMPVGIVTAFVGAPVLIGLVRRRKVSGL